MADVNLGALFGRGISFPPRVGPDGRVAFSLGADSVREAIRVILTTERRERVMLSDFGGGLGAFLFEPNTVATRQAIADRIQRALAQWEPRVVVESVDVTADPADPQGAIATITFQLVATGARERVGINVALGG